MFRVLVTPSVVASSIGGVAFCGSESSPDPRESEAEARIASSLAERLERRGRPRALPCPRFDVPLQRRYVGTGAARSPRAQMIMTDDEVSAVATLVNHFVDLSFYDEDEEQELFEFSICRLVEDLSQVLPNEVINIIHSETVLPPGDAAAFERRLFRWLLDKSELPYLDGGDQKDLVRCLVVCLMRSMSKADGRVGSLSELEIHTLVVDVFVKGTVDVFEDADERRALGDRIEGYAASIPFFPTPLLHHLMDLFSVEMTSIVTPALIEAYRAGKGSFDVASTWVFSKQRPREKHGTLCVRPER